MSDTSYMSSKIFRNYYFKMPYNNHRSSSPIYDKEKTFIVKDILTEEIPSFINATEWNHLKTGDSTRSLLTPLYATDYESHDIENSKLSDVTESKIIPQHTKKSGRSSTSSHISQRLKNNEVAGNESRSFSKRSCISGSATSLSSSSESESGSCYSVLSKTINQAPKINKRGSGNVFQGKCSEKVGKSWDQWFIEKTLAKMEAMQLTKKAEEEKVQAEIKEQEEKQRRLQQVQQNRQEWVKRKTYKICKENNEKLAQEEFERLKKEQEQELMEAKAREKYTEWCNVKKEKEKLTRQKMRVQHDVAQKKKLEKELASTEAFQNWKKQHRKQKSTRNSFGYSGGRLFCYYDMSSNQHPPYINPVPWVATTPAIASKDLECFQSPPLLWEDIERRLGKKGKRTSHSHHVIKKHSCIDVTK